MDCPIADRYGARHWNLTIVAVRSQVSRLYQPRLDRTGDAPEEYCQFKGFQNTLRALSGVETRFASQD
ncbi:MAG: hypothetical protein EAZ61_05735 [Oscillatoriales cyanobacterium]|nr:MAG: hypothetical protein EAZ61_05735 [Oscillatoriales cyanobacterium]